MFPMFPVLVSCVRYVSYVPYSESFLSSDHQAEDNTADVHLFLLHALVLRLQSGTNCRHTTLSDIQWCHVEKLEHVVALDGEMFVFRVGPTSKDSPIGQLEYYVTDIITSTLFNYWWQYFCPHSGPANDKHVYLFPKVSSNGSFDFSKKFSNDSHKDACIQCARWLGIPMSQEFRSNLGCNAVRRGNAATIGLAVRGSQLHITKRI